MPYVQGSAVDKVFKGSLEHRAMVVKDALAEHFDAPINVIAVYPEHAIFADEDGNFKKAVYKVSDEKVEDIKVRATKSIPVIEDDDVPCFVSDTIKKLVAKMSTGKAVSRTQVREMMQLLQKDEDYWLGDVLLKLEGSSDEQKWHHMYESNREQIRTAMHGKIRETEGGVPKTRYSKLAQKHLPDFEKELRESLTILRNVVSKIVDETTPIVFDKDNEFYSAIRKSLIAEAQATCGLLGKAEKLMRSEDMGRMALAHDRLAERAKTMAIVTGYLKGRSPNDDEE